MVHPGLEAIPAPGPFLFEENALAREITGEGNGTPPFAFAPVINSGTGVIVIAFIAGLITYRRMRARQGA